MKNKKFSSILCILLCFTLFAVYGCGSNKKTEPEKNVESFISNNEDILDYKIVLAKDCNKTTSYAAETLNRYINKALGNSLEVVFDDGEEQDLEIVLGKTNRDLYEGIDFDSLGEESYIVKNVGKKLAIIANDSRGLIYGVYDYLEALGYRFYTATVENIPSEDEVFVPKKIEHKWTPKLEYRDISYVGCWDYDFSLAMRLNSQFRRDEFRNNEKYGGGVGYIGGSAMSVHTFSKLLPDSYFNEHPEYFALFNGERNVGQPCLTNPTVKEIMVNKALELIQSDTKANIFNFSQNDNEVYCHCENCLKSYEKYGESGTLLRIANEIAEKARNIRSDVQIEAIAYSFTLDAPKNITLEDNVIVRICNGLCNLHTDDCENLKYGKNLFSSWAKVAKKIYAWSYICEYANYLLPIPNLKTAYNNIKIYYENNVKGIYYEGLGDKVDGEFSELKTYVFSKLMANPDMTESEYNAIIKDFLLGYYGEGGEYIGEYFDYLREVVLDNYKKTGIDLNCDVSMRYAKFLPFEFNEKTNEFNVPWLDHCNELFDKAEEYANQSQLLRLKKSRMHLRFTAQVMMFDDLYNFNEGSREELVRLNKELYDDMIKLGIVHIYREMVLKDKAKISFNASPISIIDGKVIYNWFEYEK